MNRSRLLLTGLLLVLVAGLAGFALQQRQPQPAIGASVVEALSAADPSAGFERALSPRPLVFPADHGPHPTFQTEWWYYTGNLEDASGRHFGFQLTFFRRALSPDAPVRASDWATNQIYFAHFTVTDVAGQGFYPSERFSRGAAGLAGAQAEPFRVWLEGWSATGNVSDTVRLQARNDRAAIDLSVRPLKPPALHGEHGLSRKSSQPGNASYYYSLSRLAAQGTVTINGQPFSVTGRAWMDREWSTSALEAGIAGWDWYSLQLDDGREVMFFVLRQVAGGVNPASSGSLIEPGGQVRSLTLADFQSEALDHWTSPHTGAAYPSGWRLTLPAENLTLTVTPYVRDQELPLTFAYWEGAVQVQGTSGDQPISGAGYVELTGYTGQTQGRY